MLRLLLQPMNFHLGKTHCSGSGSSPFSMMFMVHFCFHYSVDKFTVKLQVIPCMNTKLHNTYTAKSTSTYSGERYMRAWEAVKNGANIFPKMGKSDASIEWWNVNMELGWQRSKWTGCLSGGAKKQRIFPSFQQTRITENPPVWPMSRRWMRASRTENQII